MDFLQDTAAAQPICGWRSHLRIIVCLMDIKMKFLILVLLLVSSSASAAVYKCVNDGKLSYQDHPCDNSSDATKLQIGPAESSLIGCYEADFYAESGTQTARYKLISVGNGEFKLNSIGSADTTSIPMKKATPEELKVVREGFHIDVMEGVSMKWEKGTPNQKPVGIYKSIDEKGKTVYLAFFFLANGMAKKTTCP
jgi:hypothetical protein